MRAERMISVRGKQTLDVTAPQLTAALAGYASVTVDLGAGDGAFAYRYARAHSERYVIAIDPVRENLREYSAASPALIRVVNPRSGTACAQASAETENIRPAANHFMTDSPSHWKQPARTCP